MTYYTKRKPSSKEVEDIMYGDNIITGYGDINTCSSAVIKKKCIMAVGAIEGLANVIERGAGLTRGKATAIHKGSETITEDIIDTMIASGANVIAFEKDTATLADGVAQYANSKKIAIVSYKK